MLNLKKVLETALADRASDIHIKVGNYPFSRVEGELHPMKEFERITSQDTFNLTRELLSKEQQQRFDNHTEIDFSFGLKGLGRFRVAVFRQRGSIAFAFRAIPSVVPDIRDLNLPSVLLDIADSLRGMILVTGVTGSGKSTTIASMIRWLNETRTCHILTIEDPVEFLFRDERSIINQREIATDTMDFNEALKSAMRQDPDVIMVGEMRDVDTVRIALQAAQTGHLVFSTLHTTDAATTVDRIISLFPISQQQDIRLQFASALNSVVSMRLIRSEITGQRVPAVEVLRNTEFVHSLICHPDRTRELRVAMEQGHSEYGMQTFDQSILGHVNGGLISERDALRYATAPADMKLKLKGIVGASELV